ncbi:MAG: transposase [Pseudomonadota bacterium]
MLLFGNAGQPFVKTQSFTGWAKAGVIAHVYLHNIFIERLWQSLKQEAIYLEEISDGFQARRVIKDWIAFYNTERPHSALDRRTPDDAYWTGSKEQKAA